MVFGGCRGFIRDGCASDLHTLTCDFAERYFELLKDAKVKGYLFAQKNYLDEQYKDLQKK